MSIPSLAALLLLSPSLAELPRPDDATNAPPSWDEVVQEAAALLVHHQERYEADPPVGILPDDQLAAWQAKERERLDALRAGAPGREWPYEGVYRVGDEGVIPAGYRLGGTAICCEALIEVPGYAEDPARRAAVERAVDHMVELIEEDPALEPGPKHGYDVRGWGHAYALKLFLRLVDREVLDEERAAIVTDLIPHLVYCIETNALPSGGWNYAGGRASSFMTASTLLALFPAKARGHFVDEEIVEKALATLEGARHETNGAFAYAGAGDEEMPASAARAAAAELVLLRAGRSRPGRLTTAVDGFLENWEHLFARKSRQGTHEPPYQIAPYYFYYGHTYAALAIESLPEAERAARRERLRELIGATRDEGGGWNDRVFPRTESYSTAMVILALLAPDLPPLSAWE